VYISKPIIGTLRLTKGILGTVLSPLFNLLALLVDSVSEGDGDIVQSIVEALPPDLHDEL
jgi:hypothetical protein